MAVFLYNPRPSDGSVGLAESWPPRYRLTRVERQAVADLAFGAKDKAAITGAIKELAAAQGEIDACSPAALEQKLTEAAFKARTTGRLGDVHEVGKQLASAEKTQQAVAVAVQPRIDAANATIASYGLKVLDRVGEVFKQWAAQYADLTKQAAELFDDETASDEWLESRIRATEDQLERERAEMVAGGAIARLRAWGIID